MNKSIATPNTNPAKELAQQIKLITCTTEFDDVEEFTAPQTEKLLTIFITEVLPKAFTNVVYFEQLAPLAFFIITQKENKALLAPYITQLVNAVQQDATTNIPFAKIAFLLFCFNTFSPTNPLRHPIFLALAHILLAMTPQQHQEVVGVDMVLSAVTAENVMQWLVSDAELCVVYKHAYDLTIILGLNTAFSTRALLFNALNAATRAMNNDPFDEKLQTLTHLIAKEIVTLALALPAKDISLDQYLAYDDLLNNKTIITALETKEPLLLKLLNIATTATLQEVQDYANTEEFTQAVEQYALDAESTRANFIALAVADVVTAGTNYSYNALKTLFNTTDEMVIDECLVEASAVGQIAAKIHQLEKTVFVSRRIPRKFNRTQAMTQVRQRLQQWKNAIDTMNNVGVQ